VLRVCFKKNVQMLISGQTIAQGIRNITHCKSVTDRKARGVTLAEAAQCDVTQRVALTSRNILQEF
jgi:hypothetical protein